MLEEARNMDWESMFPSKDPSSSESLNHDYAKYTSRQ